jgi:V8-like Glu-specific endopeptidase
LHPGDVIQLSLEGPKLRYSLPVNAAKGASSKAAPSLGLTQRVGMVVQQTVKPYRTALIVAALLFVILIAAGSYFFYDMRSQTHNLALRTDSLQVVSKRSADSLLQAHAKNRELEQLLMSNQSAMQEQLKSTAGKLTQYQQEIDNLRKAAKATPPPQPAPEPGELIAQAIQAIERDVFYIGIKNIHVVYEGQVMMDEPQPDNCHCTGFLLDDGRFVTARHCIDLHAYQVNEFNMIANNGGKVTYDFYAISSDNQTILSFTNHDFIVDQSTDVYKQQEYNGQQVNIVQAKLFDGSDWAVFQTDRKGSIVSDPQLSANLSKGTELHCLGYTYGKEYQNLRKGLDVLYSKASVAKDGLDNNTIIVSGYGFDNGNSGGPLFTIRNGKAIVVAIVSAGYSNPSTGRDDALGSVVPIININS